jgi:hypothetical protein
MRNKVLTLEEVRQYGIDSFSDPDYVRIYGMAPSTWYGQGIRLLGRTAVECTRDALGNCIGRDIASIAARLPKTTRFTVVDPFAGSCNTLYWILRQVPNSQGLACESDRQVYELTKSTSLAWTEHRPATWRLLMVSPEPSPPARPYAYLFCRAAMGQSTRRIRWVGFATHDAAYY